MKTCRLLPLLLMGLSALAAQAQVPANASLAATVSAARWQWRILLLCAPEPDNAALLRQRRLLAPVQPQLTARDLLVREVVYDQLSAADLRYLRERLGVKTSGFVVLLLGKDGGVKRRETTPLLPAQLFSTIDAMPMRQQEMRRSN
ncbi:DUF4174 domain-containing protein [Hymenobacter rigui]|uniref:DUF4174 domain-containing protein n=1 Tax=Hymenobacter rigui TaxID=334424 RepID=A0A3R9N956_9BACT|nr:DUF4174 domain-containing protein [Hymenobacter rigui]RSK51479.1 DUF4174 domain-containing protein [Hymenobacter rigui]